MCLFVVLVNMLASKWTWEAQCISTRVVVAVYERHQINHSWSSILVNVCIKDNSPLDSWLGFETQPVSVSQKKSMRDNNKVTQKQRIFFFYFWTDKIIDLDQKKFNPEAKGCFSLKECQEKVKNKLMKHNLKIQLLFLQLKLLFVSNVLAKRLSLALLHSVREKYVSMQTPSGPFGLEVHLRSHWQTFWQLMEESFEGQWSVKNTMCVS